MFVITHSAIKISVAQENSSIEKLHKVVVVTDVVTGGSHWVKVGTTLSNVNWKAKTFKIWNVCNVICSIACNSNSMHIATCNSKTKTNRINPQNKTNNTKPNKKQKKNPNKQIWFKQSRVKNSFFSNRLISKGSLENSPPSCYCACVGGGI